MFLTLVRFSVACTSILILRGQAREGEIYRSRAPTISSQFMPINQMSADLWQNRAVTLKMEKYYLNPILFTNTSVH